MLPAHKNIVEAKAWFDERCPERFEYLLVRCLTWGIVYKTSETFLMAEPIWTNGKVIAYQGLGQPNIWFVHWLSGKLNWKILFTLGNPLKFFGFEKDGKGKLKIYRWEQALKHG